MTEDAPLTEEEQLATEMQDRLTVALTCTQEAIGHVRDVGTKTIPTAHLARADAFLAEASDSLQLAIGESREQLTPEERRIRELEEKLDRAQKDLATAHDDKMHSPPKPSVPTGRHDVRPDAAGRPRGLATFTNGHNPPPPDEPDFVSSVPAPVSGYEPGQGSGRVAQATIVGDGPSSSEAIQREQEIAAASRASIAAARARHGLPPEPDAGVS